jgi:hypothetical protein
MTGVRAIRIPALLAPLLALLLIPAALRPAEEGRPCLICGKGRVALNVPGNGGLRFCRDEGIGMRWPGADGTEFLGEGGVYFRFVTPRGTEYAGPGLLDELDVETGGLQEGCEGGKRYPHVLRDDDGDGAVDEDPVDGIDNDGDGLVDEDFAAAGDEMMATASADRGTGLLQLQSSYTWACGHVRDFVGFTTSIVYPARNTDRLSDFESVIYADFRIGDALDRARGGNDRYFVVDAGDGSRKLSIPVAADGDRQVALVLLSAAGPGGDPLGARAVITGATGSPWAITYDGDDPACILEAAGRDDVGAHSAGGAQSIDDISISNGKTGNMAIAWIVDAVSELAPGDELRIDWAIVFGKSERGLAKNARRAIETYEGLRDDEGEPHRWIVPARRAARLELEASPAFVWSLGRRQPAACIALPPSLEDEEVEWLRSLNITAVQYKQVDGKILVTTDEELVEQTVLVEGQLTDGTIFTASLLRETLLGAQNGTMPDRSLPEESIRLYPNPFLTDLNINLRIYDLAMTEEAGGPSSVKIYDVRGRLLRTVFQQDALHPGEYQYAWDGLDDAGKETAPGVYYVKLQIGDRSITKRVILLR